MSKCKYINGFGYRFNKASNKYKLDKINKINNYKILLHLYRSIQSYTQRYCTINDKVYNIYEVNDNILRSMLYIHLHNYPVLINYFTDLDIYLVFINDNLLKDNNILQDEYNMLRRIIYYSISQFDYIKNNNVSIDTLIINHFNKLEELLLMLSIANKLGNYTKDKNLSKNFCYAVSKEIELKMKQQKEDVKVED